MLGYNSVHSLEKWMARWIYLIYIDISSVSFSVMSLLSFSVRSMLFQFRVNQGENENLTGLYYLHTETCSPHAVISSPPSLCTHRKHTCTPTHSKAYSHIFFTRVLLNTDIMTEMISSYTRTIQYAHHTICV